MSVYIRRFTEDPGLDVLLNIESVNIIDQEPPTEFGGVGSGTAILVGEFENGPFNEPIEVFGASDMQDVFGGFGYTYDGTKGNNPCARSRKADGAVKPEYWNGNGFIHLNGKMFRRLILTRVDTSVGSVQFTRLASLTGKFKPTFDLEPGQTLDLKTDSGTSTVTFNATAATMTGTGGSFATIVGGDSVTIEYDGETVDVVFESTDTTVADVVSRINQAAGFALAAVSTNEVELLGLIRGTGGSLKITGASVTKLGFTLGQTASGTGNVLNIDAVTLSEVHSLVHVADASLVVTRDHENRITIVNTDTTGTATLEVKSTSTAVDFEFPFDVEVAQATAEDDVMIPAGTRVRNASGDEWVTMQNIEAKMTEYSGWIVKVRPAMDNGTASLAASSTVNVLPFPIVGGMFGVTNLLPLSAALDELAIDNAYYDAIQTTKDLNTVAREANFIWSARQSNICRRALRQNVIEASAEGCQGRNCSIRPPIGTKRSVAWGNVEPGIGAYRDERVFYNYPAASSYVPAIALVGASGGEGFTAYGIINLGSDGFAMSVCSRLPSEENPGQLTPFMKAVVGLESGSEFVGWTMADYIKLKRAGIMAPRMEKGIAIFQSGVTSVDPKVQPNRVRISRRRMADEIQDALAAIGVMHGKKLSNQHRRQQYLLDCKEYLEGLLSPNEPSKRRIDSYSIEPSSSNTVSSIAKGLYYVLTKVKTYPSLDSIVLQTEIGEHVTITEV